MTSHLVEVVGSHYHLPISNVKGVSNVQPPLNQCLHQDTASETLRKQANDRL